MKELVERWRWFAREMMKSPETVNEGLVLDKCADELEAVIARQAADEMTRMAQEWGHYDPPPAPAPEAKVANPNTLPDGRRVFASAEGTGDSMVTHNPAPNASPPSAPSPYREFHVGPAAPSTSASEAAHICVALVGSGCVGCLNYKAGMDAGREYERSLHASALRRTGVTGVTEEMVERALAAYAAHRRSLFRVIREDAMRAALTAALAAGEGGK